MTTATHPRPITLEFRETKLTGQTLARIRDIFDSLDNHPGHATLDVADDAGEIGNACIFRNDRGELCARHGTPDLRDLHRTLRRDLRLRHLTIAIGVQP